MDEVIAKLDGLLVKAKNELDRLEREIQQKRGEIKGYDFAIAQLEKYIERPTDQ